MIKKNEAINVWSYLEEYSEYDKDILQEVSKTFKSGRLIFGNNLIKFENNFSKWVGVNYGTGVGNGTDAIKIALLALGIGRGDEIITVSNTAVPTVSAIAETGASPVFCDVEDDSYNISSDMIEGLITKKTKAIVCVHLYGHPAEILKIKKLCKKNKIYLIEDCAQSHGAKFRDNMTGSFGDLSAFSFYPTKILGGFGDGGMILTNNKQLDKKAKMLRFYGMESQYFSEIPNGVNSRLDEVHAAILDFKLKRLNKDIISRRKIAHVYNKEFSGTDLVLPVEKKGYYHSYYLYVVRHKNRDKIIEKLKKENINLNISYPFPIHTMPPFRKYKRSNMKNTNNFSKEIFSLPMYPSLSMPQVDRVVSSIKKIV